MVPGTTETELIALFKFLKFITTGCFADHLSSTWTSNPVDDKM